MYSLVLISALAVAPETPGFHGFFRDLFARWNTAGCQGMTATPRYGCEGGCRGALYAVGCSGAAYSAGCYGSAYTTGCSGCQGGGLLERVRRWFDRSGCQGATYRSGCYGTAAWSCYGTAAWSCYGSPAYSYTPAFSGGTSCQGGWVPLAPQPSMEIPTNPTPLPSVPPPSIPYAPPESAPPPGSTGYTPTLPMAPAVGHTAALTQGQRGTIIVHLPPDARLYAEGRSLRQTGAERTFVTPPLPSGREYSYRFRTEYERDGQTISVTKVVKVRPGETVRIAFADLTAQSGSEPPINSHRRTDATGERRSEATAVGDAGNAPRRDERKPSSDLPKTEASLPTGTANVPPASSNTGDSKPTPSATTARFGQSLNDSSPVETSRSQTGENLSARATLIVHLPPHAALYVNEQPVPTVAAPVRRFVTPPLPVGQEYAYHLRVEYDRNGQRESLTQRVTFRPGEQIELNMIR